MNNDRDRPCVGRSAGEWCATTTQTSELHPPTSAEDEVNKGRHSVLLSQSFHYTTRHNVAVVFTSMYTLHVMSETIFPANLLTGAKHPSAFSTNHVTDTDKTKHNYN